MIRFGRFLLPLALGLPLAVQAQVPVTDGLSSGGYSQSADSYSTEAYAGGGVTTPSSAQGQLYMQLQQLQDELSRLRGMVEEQQFEIRQLKQTSLERYQELDGRLQQGASAPAASSTDASTASTPAPSDSAQAASADPEQEKLYYEAAFGLIKSKDFDKAIQAFNAFLRKYPNSQYSGNAQYWLGEVYLAQGKLQDASRAFALVGQNYPKHNKLADALYKLGDVEQRLGNTDKARGLMQEVVSKYPSSSAAKLAQRDLQQRLR